MPARLPLIGLTSHAWPGEVTRSAVVQQYVDSVLAAGGAVVAIPLGHDPDGLRAVFDLLDGLLLPGGDDLDPAHYSEEPHPMLGSIDARRDLLELTLARWAIAENLPLLGICRGAQVIAVAAGGTLYQDISSQLTERLPHDTRHHGREHLTHTVTIEPGSLLCRLVGCTASEVNSLHHQSVRDVPVGFVASAVSNDGIIEAIEATEHPFAVGIQCHPEWLWSRAAPEYRGLFEGFVAAAAAQGRLHAGRTAVNR